MIWHDAFTHCESPWITQEELRKETQGHQVCRTLGWVVREDDEYVTISISIGDGSEDDIGDCGPAVSIPRGMIVEIKELNML